MSYLNLPAISPGEFANLLPVLVKVGHPCMLWGAPGVGKSQVIKDFAKENGFGLTVRMLSQMQACDFMIPWVDQNKNTSKWALANFLAELPKDEPHILFFDELNAAPPDVQVAAYQILLDHRIGEYELPKNTYICAAGNRPEDGALASQMNTAIADRLVHCNIQPNANQWVDWAVNNDIHPHVTTFIKVKPEYLGQSEQQQSSSNSVLVVPTPRSWKRVSDNLKAQPSATALEIILCGIIGTQTTAYFKSTLEQLQNLSPIEEYFKPNLSTADVIKLMPTSFAGLYGLAYSMAAYVKTAEDIIQALGVFKVYKDYKKTKLPTEEVYITAAMLLMTKAQKENLLVKIVTKDEYTLHIQPTLQEYPSIAALAKVS